MMFLNTKTNQLHIVDYKSTSQKTEGREITLNGSWKEGIRRQMDIYVWVLRRKVLMLVIPAFSVL